MDNNPTYKPRLKLIEYMIVVTLVNGYKAIILIHQQAIGTDLISTKFCILYYILMLKLIKSVVINTVIKGS